MHGLLISQLEDEIVNKLNLSNVLLVVASTGSGKSTVMPRILASNGYTDNGIVGISQPRRVAALSLSRRVSKILNCKVGEFVGVSVRFHNNTSSKTKILFATDGVLVREAINDPTFSRFSVIIIDEAHERSLNSDILFGLLVLAQRKRSDMKLIIMSATMECEGYLKFFPDAQILRVEGRQHPIEIHHMRSEHDDYLEAAVAATLLLHCRSESGDILVFLPGQEEIESFCGSLNSKLKRVEHLSRGKDASNVIIRICGRSFKYSDWMRMTVLPLYAALPLQQQELIFERIEGGRKVIAATNIAETSLTIPGVRFVVDSGLEKQKSFSPGSGIEILALKIISKASARQRAGRAGRESRGYVYRVYTRESFDNMSEYSIPEILRTNVTQQVLELVAMGVDGISEFPLIDSPSKESFLVAIATLCRLGALDRSGSITNLGRIMVKIPTNPIYAKLLILSYNLECFQDVLTLVSMLSSDVPWISNSNEKLRIANTRSDHLTLVNLYNLYKKSKNPDNFCNTFGVRHSVIKYAEQIRDQLESILLTLKDDILEIKVPEPPEFDDSKDYILWILIKGSWIKTAILEPDGIHYRTLLERQCVKIHKSSVIDRSKLPKCIVYDECVSTSFTFVRIISDVDKFDLK